LDSEVFVVTSSEANQTNDISATVEKELIGLNQNRSPISEESLDHNGNKNDATTQPQVENEQTHTLSSSAVADSKPATTIDSNTRVSEDDVPVVPQVIPDSPEKICTPVVLPETVTNDDVIEDSSSLFNADEVIEDLLNLANNEEKEALTTSDVIETERTDDIINEAVEQNVLLKNNDVIASTSTEIPNDVINQPSKPVQADDVKLDFNDVIDGMLQTTISRDSDETNRASTDKHSVIVEKNDDIITKKPEQAVSKEQHTDTRALEHFSSTDDHFDQRKKPMVNGDSDTSSKDANSISSFNDSGLEENVADKRNSSINGMYNLVYLLVVENSLNY